MSVHTTLSKSRWAPMVAFLLVVLAGFGALKLSEDNSNQSLYRAQIAACERNNVLRQESNDRIKSHKADTGALRSFLSAAHKARITAYKRDHIKLDKDAANEYERLIGVLDTHVKFHITPLVDCKKVVEKP